jgi:hypothetical protein
MANKGGNYDKAMSIFSAAKGGNSGGGQRNNTNNNGGNRGSGIGNSGGSNYDKAMSIFSNVKANPAPPQTTGKTPDEVKLSLENKRLDKARNATKEAEKAYNEGRIYQKNYGKPGKINELKEALNQARLNERDIQNEIDINRLVRTAAGYEDDKSKKSKIDAARAKPLPVKKNKSIWETGIQIPGGGNEAGIRAKNGGLAWQSDSYKAMTDDEAEVYNRLAKNGKEKEAEAFLKAITPTLNARVTQNRLESAQKTAQDGVMGGVGIYSLVPAKACHSLTGRDKDCMGLCHRQAHRHERARILSLQPRQYLAQFRSRKDRERCVRIHKGRLHIRQNRYPPHDHRGRSKEQRQNCLVPLPDRHEHGGYADHDSLRACRYAGNDVLQRRRRHHDRREEQRRDR